MQTQNLCAGVDLHRIDAPKFKTNLLSLYFHIPLRRDTVTMAALLPSVMKRGTAKFPTFTAIAEYLENLYGASCSAGIRFKGDGEVLYFSVEYIRDRFIGEKLTGQLLDFLREWVFAPYLHDGVFCADYVKGEKENLKNAIEGLINDKKEYAEVKCREAMFGCEGYGMFEAGYVEDLPDITPKRLYDFYLDVLQLAKVDIFASGSFDDDLTEAVKAVLLPSLPPRDAAYPRTEVARLEEGMAVRRVEEEIDVVQSKLCLGLRCGISPTSDMYYALMLASCIYGGSPFSKLFNNVREKLSLAYYAVSRLERFKSVMTVSSGIQTEKFDAAYQEILLQLDKMKNGDFTDGEIEAAKKYLTTGLQSMKDGLRTMEDYYLSQCIMGQQQDIDDLLAHLMQVDRAAIQKAAQGIVLDTVFFLKGNQEGGADTCA